MALIPLYYNDQTGTVAGPNTPNTLAKYGIPAAFTDSDVSVNALAGASYSTLNDFLRYTSSTGIITGGVMSDGGAGTLDITISTFLIRSTSSETGQLYFGDLAAVTGQALTDNSANYIYIGYNAGVPALNISTTELTDYNTNVILGVVYREGTTLHISNANIPTVQTPQKLARRLSLINGVTWQSGLAVSETGTRNIAITAGDVWLGLDEYTIAAIDTSVADTFNYYYRDGIGGWTEVTSSTQINNTQYDDGSGTLATLTANRYGVHWLYRAIDGDTYVVYGQGDYTLQQAEDADVPAALPLQITGLHAILVAKIEIQKDSATITSIGSAFTQQFTSGLATDHGDLAGLADDDHTQYVLVNGTRLPQVPTAQKSTAYTVGTDTTSEQYGGIFYATATMTFTLPAVAAGMSFTFVAIGAVTITIDPNASDLIYLDGTAQSDGVTIVSPGAAGDLAVLTYYDGTGWVASTNTWTTGA